MLLTGSLNHRFLYVYHDERSRVVFFFFISLCEYISFAFCKNDFNRSGDLALCSGVIVFFLDVNEIVVSMNISRLILLFFEEACFFIDGKWNIFYPG